MAKQNKALGVNPAVLRWARESMGLTVENVAERLVAKKTEQSFSQRLQKRIEAIQNWETGSDIPSIPQLKTLAENVYKRPFLLFFFPEPPEEENLGEKFRASIPNFQLEPDTVYKLRLANVRLMELKELYFDENPATQIIFRDIHLDINENVGSAVDRVRDWFTRQGEELNTTSNDTEFLKTWRERLERFGVFVFKDSFKQKVVSGFCVLDEVFPLIYINNSIGKTRQLFTLIHELAHVLLGSQSILIEQTDSGEPTHYADMQTERFCNAFAAELLVPGDDLHLLFTPSGQVVEDLAAIRNIAQRFGVSREVMVRKMHELNIITYGQRVDFLNALYAEYQSKRSKSSRGDYYNTRLTYLGDKYTGKVISELERGRFNLEEAAEFLSVKPKSVAEIQDRVEVAV